MAKTLTLKREAVCADCGATLPAGARARYYGPKHIYGLECHEQKPYVNTNAKRNGNDSPRALTQEESENWSPGRIASHYDPTGAYSPDGTFLGKSGPRCEDAPCCGCCP
jgi:hypothetical protein